MTSKLGRWGRWAVEALFVLCVFSFPGCRSKTPPAPADSEATATTTVSPGKPPGEVGEIASPLRDGGSSSPIPGSSVLTSRPDVHGGLRTRPEPLPVCQSQGMDPLAASRRYYDEDRFGEALSCAAKACALQPDSAQAHSERAAALSALGRFEEAALAYSRTLAVNPDHLDGLLGAAHLYIVSLPSSRERDELGVLYSERGVQLCRELSEPKLATQFAMLSAMAFNDLGQATEALQRTNDVLRAEPHEAEASYERAIALFELSRFTEAKNAFSTLLQDRERSAHAYYHLGLLLERESAFDVAERYFSKARSLSILDFVEPHKISPQEFRAEVERAVKELPEDMRKDLEGVPVEPEELPSDRDLTRGKPPLSPTILGLFRGPSLRGHCGPQDGVPCRSIALYRRNLLHAARTRLELLEQIRVTLLHEVGHLRGEDDFELAARGLE